MVIEMFKRSKSKTNVNSDSKESLDSGTQSSSSETAESREKLFESTASIHRVSQFEVDYLGMIQDVNLGGVYSRDPDVQLIDKVEEAQLEGKIGLVPQEDDRVLITISKHGIKVTGKLKREVLQRHPLHNVSQIVYYIDSFFKSNLALKIGQVGRTVYDCYVFQSHSEAEAQSICQSVKDVFDLITTPKS